MEKIDATCAPGYGFSVFAKHVVDCWRRCDFDSGRRFWLPHLSHLQFPGKQSFIMHAGGSMNSGALGQSRIGANTACRNCRNELHAPPPLAHSQIAAVL